MSLSPKELEEHEQYRIDYLIENGEAVQYGERWTPETTHEWWVDESGKRQCRLVMTYHGRGARGDDDEAEYIERLLSLGRAKHISYNSSSWELGVTENVLSWPDEVTHVIDTDGKLHRFRYYVPPPENLGGR